MTAPLVSIVIATYNMASYLPLAIRSALAQTYPNIEVLVIDDGSTDGTSAAMDAFRAETRLRYIVQKNGGQASAKNHGIREARGDFVAFLDADDLWVPRKLELQMPLFEKNPAVGIVHARVEYIDETGKSLGVADNRLFRGRVSGPLLIENFIGFGTTVVRRDCFERFGAFKEQIRMGIDYDLWLRFSTQYEFDFVDSPLLLYRTWSGQMSKNCRGRYASGIAIMRGFLAEYPRVVDSVTVKTAWAHTYAGYAQCMLQPGGSIGNAIGFYAKAVGYRPLYAPTWKAIVKSVLRMRS